MMSEEDGWLALDNLARGPFLYLTPLSRPRNTAQTINHRYIQASRNSPNRNATSTLWAETHELVLHVLLTSPH
jgi:hypothetical protein